MYHRYKMYHSAKGKSPADERQLQTVHHSQKGLPKHTSKVNQCA